MTSPSDRQRAHLLDAESVTRARAATRRGTTSKNAQGGSEDRRRRKVWLVQTFRADVDLLDPERGALVEQVEDLHGQIVVPLNEGIPACRCYRCGKLLDKEHVSPDRIVPGCEGGTYKRSNIRPACDLCQMKTGGALGAARKAARR